MRVTITDADYAQACAMEHPFRDLWTKIKKRARNIALDRLIAANLAAQAERSPEGVGRRKLLEHMDRFERLGREYDALMEARFGPPPFAAGTRVRTMKSDGSRDWAARARENVQWRTVGTIVQKSDSHGLCYEVQHDDGTCAWYNHGELVKIGGQSTR